MTKWKKASAAILAAAMTMSLLAGCGSADTKESTKDASSKESVTQKETSDQAEKSEEPSNEPVDVTYPMDTDVTLRVYVDGGLTLSSNYTDFNDVPFTKGLEKKTGVDVQWETFAVGGDAGTSYNLLLQEEELPDIIMGYHCDPGHMKDMLDAGILMDISEYLPIYAPDYWAYVNGDDNYAVRNKAKTSVEGKVMNFMGTRESTSQSVYNGMMIRKDWLDELGLEVPETVDEFMNVARAFHEEYGAILVGKKSRIDACGFVSSGVGAFAVFGRNYYVEDGVVKLANAQEEWKESLILMNQLYEEGILDQNFTGATDETVRRAAAEGKTGLCVTVAFDPLNFKMDAEEFGTGAEWIAIPGLVEEKGGDCKFHMGAYSTYDSTIGAYVTTSCSEEKIATALQFLNYGYTEEGKVYWNFGEEGVSFEYDEEGKPVYTDLILNDPRGINPAILDYCGTLYYGPASILTNDAIAAQSGKESVEAEVIWNSNNVYHDYLVPPLTYTDEEKIQRSDIDSALATYIDEMAIKFVTGEESLDNFDDYLETLNTMGVETVLEIMNDAYQRSYGK